MYHNQFGRWIDKDHLATDAQQHEPTVGAGQQPDLVAIPVVLRGYTRREISIGRTHRRRIQQPLPWDDLASVPRPVIRQQASKTGVVAQHSIKAAKGHLLAGAVGRPRGIGLRPYWLPYLLAQIIG